MAGLAKGSLLFAALHSSLEHIKIIKRVCRALTKKPQLRTSIEVGYIMGETERLALMTRDGPGVHRDLCHVARVVSLKEMESFKLPLPSSAGDEGGAIAGGSGHGLVYIYVLQGRVQLRTRNRDAFAPRLALRGTEDTKSSPGQDLDGTVGGGSGLENVTEEDMMALFKSIDADGSGAITVTELQVALELMGIHKSEDEVSEMLDGVDADGSGEMEFTEFKAVLRRAIRSLSGTPIMTEWNEQGGGMWFRDLPMGTSAGEAAMMDPVPLPQDGLVLALDAADLLILERYDYEHILENGFDGELKAKMALLRSAPVLGDALHRTDLRMLAYAMARRTVPMNAALYEQGQPPASLDLILQGHCKVVVRVPCEPASTASSRRTTDCGNVCGPGMQMQLQMQEQLLAQLAEEGVAGAGSGSLLRRAGPHMVRTGKMKRLELAVLGPGDMCSEASVLGDERHPHSCVVTDSRGLVALSLSVRDLRKLVHPSDLKLLREHFERRYSQRSTRMAAAASVAALSTAELGRRLQQQDMRVTDLDGLTGGGAESRRGRVTSSGLGDVDEPRPGTTAAALERLAAVMRQKVRPVAPQTPNDNGFATGVSALLRQGGTPRSPSTSGYGGPPPSAERSLACSHNSSSSDLYGIGAASMASRVTSSGRRSLDEQLISTGPPRSGLRKDVRAYMLGGTSARTATELGDITPRLCPKVGATPIGHWNTDQQLPVREPASPRRNSESLDRIMAALDTPTVATRTGGRVGRAAKQQPEGPPAAAAPKPSALVPSLAFAPATAPAPAYMATPVAPNAAAPAVAAAAVWEASAAGGAECGRQEGPDGCGTLWCEYDVSAAQLVDPRLLTPRSAFGCGTGVASPPGTVLPAQSPFSPRSGASTSSCGTPRSLVILQTRSSPMMSPRFLADPQPRPPASPPRARVGDSGDGAAAATRPFRTPLGSANGDGEDAPAPASGGSSSSGEAVAAAAGGSSSGSSDDVATAHCGGGSGSSNFAAREESSSSVASHASSEDGAGGQNAAVAAIEAASRAAEAMEYGTTPAAAAGIWSPAPPRLAADVAGQPRPKWTASRFTRAMTEGRLSLEGPAPPGGQLPPQQQEQQQQLQEQLQLQKWPTRNVDVVRGVNATSTPPTPPPRSRGGARPRAYQADEGYSDMDEWDAPLVPYPMPSAPSAASAGRAGGYESGDSGLGFLAARDYASSDRPGSDENMYDIDALPCMSAASPPQDPSPLQAPAVASLPQDPSPLQAPAVASPRPPEVPKLSLRKLRVGGAGGAGAATTAGPEGSATAAGGGGDIGASNARPEWTAAAVVGGGAAGGLSARGGGSEWAAAAGGRSGASTARGEWAITATAAAAGGAEVPLLLSSRNDMVNSVKAMLHGWHTSRATSSSGEASPAAPPPPAILSGAAAAGATSPRSAMRFVTPEATRSPAAASAAAAAAFNSWKRESVAVAVTAAQGERGRLAAIYSGMLRHGEATVRSSLEYALLQQHNAAQAQQNQQQQRHQQQQPKQKQQQRLPAFADEKPAVLWGRSTPALVPTTHKPWTGSSGATSSATSSAAWGGGRPGALPPAAAADAAAAAALTPERSAAQAQLLQDAMAEAAAGGGSWRQPRPVLRSPSRDSRTSRR